MNELKKRFEERFTFEMAPSTDPNAKPPYNAPQRMLGKVISVADSGGKIPNGIKMPTVAELWDFFATEMKEMLERVRLEKKESGCEYSWECPNTAIDCDGGWGNEGEYCSHCRRKLVKKERRWETDSDEGYNQAVDDLDEKIKKEGI